MQPTVRSFLWLLAVLLLLRWITMAVVPMADTTEPRYAEMARIMAVTDDWITPWYDYKAGKPFWGKPPLSFWAQAASIKLFGSAEFAPRLPSWIATLITLWMVFALGRNLYGERAAQWATLIFATCALTYVIAGSVLTDPYLTLSTTWIMASLLLYQRDPRWYWRYGVFLGGAIGLLAKGPLVLVLVGGAVVPWMLFFRDGRKAVAGLPWITGLLLTCALVAPWYVLAEMKTPGFLHYFIVGEHIMRFINPGWGGDLYGDAHQRVRGTIWLFWLGAAFPWSFWAIGLIGKRLANTDRKQALMTWLRDPTHFNLLMWSLFTPAFFTLAGNILWTYLLPALPAFSVLLGHVLAQRLEEQQAPGNWLKLSILVAPLGVLVLGLVVTAKPTLVPTEKPLLAFVKKQQPDTVPTFIGRASFSARYYSQENLRIIPLENLPQAVLDQPRPMYLAVFHRYYHIKKYLPPSAQVVYSSLDYQVYEVPAHATMDQASGNPHATTRSATAP